jgi:methenyltetrahydrofolate cyclohydrolase
MRTAIPRGGGGWPYSATMPLDQRTLADALDRFAAREPAPGGGSAAALTGALAAALTEMAAAFAITSLPAAAAAAAGGAAATAAGGAAATAAGDPARVAEARDRALELRAHLLSLAEQDTLSYAPVLVALAIERSDPDRPARLQSALAAAAEVPLAIATAAAEVAELAAAAARAGSPHLFGDATAATVLAEAAVRSAVALVELNLDGSPQDARVERAGEMARRAWAAREAVLGAGRG